MYNKEFLNLFKKGKKFVISTHKFCDGDGLGAGLALCYALRKKGCEAKFLSLEKIHPKYEFMNKDKTVSVFKGEDLKVDGLIFVDVNDVSLVEPLYDKAKEENCPIFFIDHHPLTQKTKDQFFIDVKASSTAELIEDLIEKIKIPMDEMMATCLFASIVFDTSLFREVKNSEKPFLIAAKLVPFIKDLNLIYDNLFKRATIGKMQFLSRIEDVEYHFLGRVAFLHLKEKVFKKYDTDETQAYDLMDLVKNIKTLESSALLIEKKPNSFKVSLRSRTKDLLPLAESLGGGGHKHSAGAYVKEQNLEELKEKILKYLK